MEMQSPEKQVTLIKALDISLKKSLFHKNSCKNDLERILLLIVDEIN